MTTDPFYRGHFHWEVKSEPTYTPGENMLSCACGEFILVTTPTTGEEYREKVGPFYAEHKDCGKHAR